MFALRLLVALVMLGVMVTAGSAAAADSKGVSAKKRGAKVDTGVRQPPKNLSDYHKAIWMTEWVACWRPETMVDLARELKMLAKLQQKAKSPQHAARLLSVRAMRFLYEDPREIRTARDGCRNGILWRRYHGR